MSLVDFKKISFKNDKKMVLQKVLALKRGKLAVCSPWQVGGCSVPGHAG